MLRKFQTDINAKIIIILFLTPILLLGVFIMPVKSQEAGHLVISAVQITGGDGKTGHDFVELYNPTGQDINLKGYRLVKRTKTGASDSSIKSWTDDVFIKAHGWRLWASSSEEGYNTAIGADDATKQTLAADNGIAIRLGAADTGEIIDSAAWGAAENIFKEIASAVNPAADESIVRKPGNGANGEDTGNNASDFFIIGNYTLHNSDGYVPDVLIPEPTSAPVPTPAASAGLNPQNSTDSGLSDPLVAEAGADKEAAIGQAVSFDGSDSYDPEGKVLEYNWDFGDGAKVTGANASHVFNSAGEFKVVLKVTGGSRLAEDFLAVKIVEPDFSDKIILSEILPDPVGPDKDGEWIEVYNSGDKKINLKGWMLDDKTGGGAKPYVFPEDTFLEAKSYLAVSREKSKIVLANAGGEVNLLWYNGKILSKIIYGAAEEGQSYALINSEWQWTGTPSAGKENSVKKIVATGQSRKKEPVLPVKAEENIVKVAGEITKTGKPKQEAAESGRVLEEAALAPEAPDEIIIGGGNTANNALENFKKRNNDQAEEKNNPWFWGNMALSAVSLFLVWRYQNLKKKVK